MLRGLISWRNALNSLPLVNPASFYRRLPRSIPPKLITQPLTSTNSTSSESSSSSTSLPTSFAVVWVTGHQYKVCEGDRLFVEKVTGKGIGDTLVLDKVCLLGSKERTLVGCPIVPNASVSATVEEQALTDKVIVFKKKRRKRYQRTHGHRSEITGLWIRKINWPSS